MTEKRAGISAPALLIEDLRFAYDREEVLKGLSLSLPGGALTAIVGPNGSGKSTLLKTLVGIEKPGSGRLLIRDEERGFTDLSALSLRERARMIAYLPQQRNVPGITAERLVLHGRFPYLSYPRRYSREDVEAAERALAATGSSGLAKTELERMSGGQRQKVYISMALAQNAGLLLLDEPATFLDICRQIEILKLLKSLTRPESGGKTVAVVMHDIVQALRYADFIAVIEDGRTAAFGAPDDIYESGVLDRVFGVGIHRIDAPSGPRYYVE